MASFPTRNSPTQINCPNKHWRIKFKVPQETRRCIYVICSSEHPLQSCTTSTTCSTVSTNGFDSSYRELELIKPVAFFPLLVSKVQIPFLLRSAHSPRRNLRVSSEMQARTGSDVTTAQSPGDVTAVT